MAKKKKKKRRKKPAIVRLQNKADKALSRYMRTLSEKKYGICPICNVKEIECCFHFISRRRKILRWDERNVVGACHTCNFIERRFPDLSRAWFIIENGVSLYLDLVVEAKKTFKPTTDYLEIKIAEYEKKLELLEEEREEHGEWH